LHNVDENIEEIRNAFHVVIKIDVELLKIQIRLYFAVRFISTYITFYKAVISMAYWKELDNGLPLNESVLIKRWPGKNGLQTSLDINDPNGRQGVLLALAKLDNLF
jgi:hypothetical protein